jgi:hypothetical protein
MSTVAMVVTAKRAEHRHICGRPAKPRFPRAPSEAITEQDALLHVSPFNLKESRMNQIIYIVGLVVIVIAVLSFFGLR